ncbi:putative holin-like toxin [Ligilactobacillus salitolerans]
MEETAERLYSQLSVFEALSLMIAFGILVAVLSNKKGK